MTPAVSRFVRALSLALILQASFSGLASTNSAWSVHVWQSDDGLPNNDVTGLAQTSDGYLWAATPTRLARFDGVSFEEFSPQSVVPGHSQRISTLLPARDGSFWLAMDHGPVVCLGPSERTVFTNNLPDRIAQSMVEDGEGGIWVTYTGSLSVRIKNGVVRAFTTRDGLPGGSGPSFAVDTKGRIWFAKAGQIGLFRNDRFEALAQYGNAALPVHLAASRAGGVWICAGLHLLKYDESGEWHDHGTLRPDDPATEPNILLEDRNGAVWLGTSSCGLFRNTGSHFEPIPTSHREILSLLEDREGNLWAGTGGGGLDRIQPRSVELEDAVSGLPFQSVQSLCEDKSGVLWAATQAGLLACRSNETWTTVSASSTWPGGRASAVTCDRAGAVWIGTLDRALHRWMDGEFTSLRTKDGLTAHVIHSLLAAQNGDLYVGQAAPETLQRLRNGKLQGLKVPPDARVMRAMAEDSAGNIWIGTANGFLLRVSGGEVLDATPGGSKPQPGIRSLYATPDGSLWIGYAGSGLARLKDGQYTKISIDQGLYDPYISEIIGDDRGWLWFGADHGIFKIRQEEFEALAGGKTPRLRSVHYGRDEGLPSLQANFGSSPGALRSSDGRLWIPMRTALAVVNPDHFRKDPEPPPVLLKRVAVDDRTVALYYDVATVRKALNLQAVQPRLSLPPGHHHLAFEFTALSFTAPENVHFQYRLEKFDDDWIEGGTRRNADYSGLPAGDYRFRVKASNRDGVWNEAGASLSVTIAPFVWQTWWFRFASVGAFTAAVVMIARYASFRRLRVQLAALEQQAALDRERARIARDIHDDLGGSMTQVELMLATAAQEHAPVGKAAEHTQRLCAAVRQVSEGLDEIVWAVNPRNDTLPDLIDYLSQFAVEFLRTAGIPCRVDLPERPPRHPVSPEMRHNFFMAVKESLNNIIRHAAATEVRLQIALSEAALDVVVEDNGRGFDTAPERSGADGLRNMRQRMEDVGGQFHIESKSGYGTRVCLTLPCLKVRS